MEEIIKMKVYEGMFLLDGVQSNFELACEPIHNVLDRSGAELQSIRLWEDRKLAYEIKGRKRGAYVLAYFKMDVSKIVELEHDCQLNESILRVLFRRKDNLTDEEMNAPTPAMLEATTREHETKPKVEDEQKPTDEKVDGEPKEAIVEEKTEEPATTEEPASAEESATTEEPASAEEPATTEEPASAEEPATTEEPASEVAEKESAE